VWARGFTDITWVHFYNEIVLLVMDFVMGIFLGVFVWNNPQWVFEQSVRVHNFIRYDFSQSYIEWLMGWPAGFKLNEELDLFLGNIFLLYIDNWSVIALYLAKAFPIVIKIISIFGLFGMSSVMALISDIVAFLNMHIYWLYTAIAKAISVQLSALSSLWLLFRGKKRNVLKNRIDSCNYTIDQLLLGTLLFCVLVFLLPTMGTYFLFFWVARGMVLCVHVMILAGLVICEHFPLLPLVLFFGKSSLLSGGVRIELCPTFNIPTRNEILENKKFSGSDEDNTNQNFSSVEDNRNENSVYQQQSDKSELVSEITYFQLKPNPLFAVGFFFEEMKNHLIIAKSRVSFL